VADEIQRALRMRAPLLVRTSCERPNLALEVVRTPTEARKRAALASLLVRAKGQGIVYTTTVKTAERLWSELVASAPEEGIGRYHGELPLAMREATQQAFMDGRYRVLVATTAFGMGVDKADVRFVVHYQLPDSLESYQQEVGRAGRDGEPARAVLFYRAEDKRVHDFFLARKFPNPAEIARVLDAIGTSAARSVIATRMVADALRVSVRKVEVTMQALAYRGVLVAIEGQFLAETPRRAAGELAGVVASFEERREHARARVRAMMTYCEHVECRWRQVRREFGEAAPAACGRCDVCRS
jgi:ATP-dependent DNA helicase RecQ